jgi:hypothetical protein
LNDQFTLEILEVFYEELDLIVQKISSKCSKSEICQWLDNFEPDDRIAALEILQKLLYVNENQLFIGAEQMIDEIISKVPQNSTFYFYPIAKYGKSSTLFAYYLKKSPNFKKLLREQRAFFLRHQSDYESTVIYDQTVLVFFDDFFGSGGSFMKSHRNIDRLSSPRISSARYQFAASLYRMETAETLIKQLLPNIQFVGKRHYQIFGDTPGMFATPFQIVKKKAIASTYAIKKHLFTSDSNNHDLGYKGSQALISFAYMPPNNTLPIIWSSKSGWRPLLPRDFEDIQKKENDYRSNTLAAAAKLEFGLRPGEYQNYDKNRLNILLILTYIRRKVAFPLITIDTGIDSEYLDELLKRAQQMEYLNGEFKLTEKAIDHLTDLYHVKQQFASIKKQKTDVRNFEIPYVVKTVPRK